MSSEFRFRNATPAEALVYMGKEFYTSQQSLSSYAFPLLGAYSAVFLARNLYLSINNNYEFYKAASKKDYDTKDLLSKKNITQILTPYGDLCIKGFKQVVWNTAELGFIASGHYFIPQAYPVIAAYELYTIGSAVKSVAQSAYSFCTSDNSKSLETDWLIAGILPAVAINTMHLAVGPMSVFADLYAVMLALKAPTNDEKPAVVVEEQKPALQFTVAANKESPRLAELATTQSCAPAETAVKDESVCNTTSCTLKI